MRIGVIGGSFNPVHNGHLMIARSALEKLGLDKVIFVPAKVPPHKKVKELASAKDRLKMTKLAIEGYANFEASDMELRRRGKSYTIDTIKELRKIFPDAEIFFLIGADTIRELPTWKNIQELTDLCQFVTVTRIGSSKDDFDSLKNIFEEEKIERLKKYFIEAEPAPVSATEIRKKVARGESISGMVSPSVERYITEKGLYR